LSYNRGGLFGGLPVCLGDVNGDYIIGSADLMLLLSCWGLYGCSSGDFNYSGVVNVYDLNIFLSLYGTICEGHPLWD